MDEQSFQFSEAGARVDIILTLDRIIMDHPRRRNVREAAIRCKDAVVDGKMGEAMRQVQELQRLGVLRKPPLGT